ncbi:Phosphatidylglycerol--prolipoprotein diacylglyceryl transferase [Flavobacterium bizetiae]|uniref:Phosphatidylglycerol--prolipoprotein diacylglyceryl transferase n=1 Tax=Flavobacterium bizetiae TaxID=2704140 RepID=A0A6J4G8N7_9FLAO|nr:prolipoprotein diacylglyceryl transferase [Flavobacterium bizetiae]CAA9195428.1 Phosphatidylglycerol--prolipoprotein diacylglyceryl transferase [Flavobacterium bizetiae]CAD5340357.1 Phosphatidylglycerol--prolipoprotein diacylglyceryl transferase [Flavobacterium bizetiae]CAD5346520.1 Phosphatidylglycerol--prolipoprotein diacylglyceryl transferase [Flavobacterium bizetiae]
MNGILNWNVDPVIFMITDSFPLKYYGALFACGLLLGYYIVRSIYKKEHLSLDNLDSLLVYVIVGTILGARLGHCFFYEPAYFLQHPIEILLPIQKVAGVYKFVGYQGLASHGGSIGVLIAMILYCRKYKVKFLWILDKMAIGVPVTGAFIRFGNFMNSEIYGKPTNGNWGVVFERDDMIPRHPTQLYEAFAYLLIFGIVLYLYKSKNIRKSDGLIFGYFLTLMFVARFIIEFFKENQESFENNMIINMGQILSIPFILIGVALIIWKSKKV